MTKAESNAKYHAKPGIKEQRTAYQREYRNRPEVKARRAAWLADPENRERVRAKNGAISDRIEQIFRRVKYQSRLRGETIEIEFPSRPRPELCELCGEQSSMAPALDHCHQTGKFRGWLCVKCNSGIGMARDNPELLRKWVTYLESFR